MRAAWPTTGVLKLGVHLVPEFYQVCPDAKTVDDGGHRLVVPWNGVDKMVTCVCGRQFYLGMADVGIAMAKRLPTF